MQKKIESALALIRPVLQQDGGDIELVEVTPDNTAKVRLLGRCSGCPKSGQTLKSVVTKTLLKTVSGLRKVEAVQ